MNFIKKTVKYRLELALLDQLILLTVKFMSSAHVWLAHLAAVIWGCFVACIPMFILSFIVQ